MIKLKKEIEKGKKTEFQIRDDDMIDREVMRTTFVETCNSR